MIIEGRNYFFFVGIKIFSAQIIKQLCYHATELVHCECISCSEMGFNMLIIRFAQPYYKALYEDSWTHCVSGRGPILTVTGQ